MFEIDNANSEKRKGIPGTTEFEWREIKAICESKSKEEKLTANERHRINHTSESVLRGNHQIVWLFSQLSSRCVKLIQGTGPQRIQVQTNGVLG